MDKIKEFYELADSYCHFVTYNPIIGDGDWIFPFSRVLRGILLPSLIYFLWRCGSVSISLQL